jgi:transcription initiation factor TFIID subunit 1
MIENDLYRAPIFKTKLPETDFLLVRRKRKDGESYHYEYSLRQIDHIYLVGQIEPKQEIFTPHSRSLGTFLKNCLKTYIK